MVPKSIKQLRSRYIQKKDKDYVLNRFEGVTKELIQTKNDQRIILVGTSVYGNLGDQAISQAEMTFLTDSFPEHTVIELPNNYYLYQNKLVKENITTDDVLVINGGGFMGTLWPAGEDMARDVVTSFKNNKVVILPQTIFFSNNETGKLELEKSKAIYQNHPNITLFVRDSRSLHFANEHLRGNLLQDIQLVPDIVTYLNRDIQSDRRNTILFCMRTDKEKVDNDTQLAAVEAYLAKNNNLPIVRQDTVVDERIDLYNRDEELDKMLAYFYDAKLVITDRLHGMVLSAITGTPCLALNNVSGKVKGQFEWLEHLGYVKYVEDPSQIDTYLADLLALEESRYDNSKFVDYHQAIAKAINPER